MNSEFAPIDVARQQNKNPQNQRTNFDLGQDQVQYQTASRSDFKTHDKRDFPQIVKKYTTSSVNIEEGEPNDYRSVQAMNYVAHDVSTKQVSDAKRFHGSNFTIGDGVTNVQMSSTQQMLSESAVLENVVSEQLQNKYAQNVHLGDDKFYGESETRSVYKQYDLQA